MQVEAALTTEPENEDLLKLKSDLQVQNFNLFNSLDLLMPSMGIFGSETQGQAFLSNCSKTTQIFANHQYRPLLDILCSIVINLYDLIIYTGGDHSDGGASPDADQFGIVSIHLWRRRQRRRTIDGRWRHADVASNGLERW